MAWTLRGVQLPGRSRSRLEIPELSLQAGVTVVLGPSGAGKSSLLELLVGYIRPAAGRVELPPCCAWVGNELGLWPGVDVLGHLRLVGADSGRSAAILEEMLLTNLAKADPATLSAGEAERLAVARALAAPGTPLVLDEAPCHCEPALADQIWSSVVRRCREEGRALVAATHQPERALADADRVLCLAAGRVIWEGSPQVLYHQAPDPALAAYLGPVNWGLESAWLPAAPLCLRPELLHVLEDGPQAVVAHRNAGSVAWTRLRRGDGAEREVVHRPARPVPVGAAVRLVLAALLLLLAACGGGDDPAPWFRRAWPLPVAGTQLPTPRGLGATRDGGFLVLDGVGRVLRHDAAGQCTASWWMPEHTVGRPEGVLELADGAVAVADTHYHRVIIFEADGRERRRFGSEGIGPGQFGYPIEICADGADGLFVAEYGGGDRIQRFAADDRVLGGFGSFGAGTGQFQRPGGMARLGQELIVVDAFNNRLQRWSLDGQHRGSYADGVEWRFPYDCAVGPDGDVWVVEHAAARLTRLAGDGSLKARYGGPGSGRGQFSTPWAVTVLADGRVIVADTGNRRLVEVVP